MRLLECSTNAFPDWRLHLTSAYHNRDEWHVNECSCVAMQAGLADIFALGIWYHNCGVSIGVKVDVDVDMNLVPK